MLSLVDSVSAADLVACFIGTAGIGVALYGHWRIAGVEKLKSKLERETEAFKSKLDAERETELERLRSDLKIITHEREVVLSQLQAKRATVIDRLHELLVSALKSYAELTSLLEWSEMGTKQDRAKAFINQYNEFVDYYQIHRIYLEENLCLRFDNLIRELHSNFVKFQVFVLQDEKGTSDEYIKTWQECWNASSKVIPELRLELEQEFRKLLGVKATQISQEATAMGEEHSAESE